MSKFGVYYYSKTGHTKALADAIAGELGVEAHCIYDDVDDDIDTLFLGSSIYGNSIDPAMIDFFSKIEGHVNRIVSFGTSGMDRSTYDEIKDLADSYGIEIDEDEFHVSGEFAGINAGRPNSGDLERACMFASRFKEIL